MPERENPAMIWFKIGKTEGTLGEYRGFFIWEEIIDKIKHLVRNSGRNLLTRSARAPHAVECNEFRGAQSIYLYWGDEFGKLENPISDAEIAMLNTAIFQGIGTLPNEPNNITTTVGEQTMKIDVPVHFQGVVSVEVPADLPVEIQKRLAQKLALARVVATTDNPDAPEEAAFEDYVVDASVFVQQRAVEDWDFASGAEMGVGGNWCLQDDVSDDISK